MKISALFEHNRPIFSFEFFPPKDDAAAGPLMETIQSLEALSPDFVSVTYGAGGSTRARTLDLVSRIRKQTGLEPMAHLTCVGHSKQEIREILKELAARGVENILALRGDPPKGETAFKPHPDGFSHANELAEEVRRAGFCFGVAGYPEKHPEAPDLDTDLRNLKRKTDAGAAFVTTQLFFNNTDYFEFVSRARAIGIECPILPGIMPMTNVAQIQRFTSMCGAKLPKSLIEKVSPVKGDSEEVERVGVLYAIDQCRELLEKGAPGIHFYTLNKSRATRQILENLQRFRAPSITIQDI